MERELVCAKNARTGPDGKKYIVDYYNLDVVISVGYRVKSKRGVMFRKWASNVLKQYLLRGYALDKERIIISKENYLQIESDILDLKREVEGIKENVFLKPVKEKVLYDGEYFDAYSFVSSLIKKAKRRIIIIDPYLDIKGLIMLKHSSFGPIKTVCTSSKTKLLNDDIMAFKKQYGDIHLIINDTFHDRFLLIDENECYSLGASLNYMGKRTFAIIKLEDEESIKRIIKKVDENPSDSTV